MQGGLMNGISIWWVVISDYVWNYWNRDEPIFGKKDRCNFSYACFLLFIIPLTYQKELPDLLLSISSVIFIFLFIVIEIVGALIDIKSNFSSNIINKVYRSNIILKIYIMFSLIFGISVVIKVAKFENSFYSNSSEVISIIIICAIIIAIVIYKYINDYHKLVRNICYINFVEVDGSKPIKYYILYTADKDYVVCGKKDRYEDNKEFRYIKISEIKDKYLIYYEDIIEGENRLTKKNHMKK